MLGVLNGADAAADLELDLRALCLHDQLGSVDAGAGVAKAGAGFVKVDVQIVQRLHSAEDLLICEGAGLEDDLDYSPGRPLGQHGSHIPLHSAVVAGLDAPQRRHHIHLAGAIGKSLVRCRSLDRRRLAALGKADHRADRHAAGKMRRQGFHIAGLHTEAGNACALSSGGKGEDLLLGGAWIEVGMVNGLDDCARIHHIFSNNSTIIWLTTPGLAWPLVAFITWPTKKPRAFFLPAL